MRSHNPAYRVYNRRIAIAAAVYLVSILGAVKILHHHAPPSPLAIGVALIPGIAVSMMIYAVARLLLDLQDEYLRLLEVRKVLVATALTLVVCSVWGLLEIFTAVPALPVFWVYPLWAVGQFAGIVFNRLTLGTGGCL